MKLLFYLFIYLFMYITQTAYSSTGIKVEEVMLNCETSFFCQKFKTEYSKIKGDYRDLEHLESSLKIYLSRGGVKNVNYKIYRSNKSYSININLTPKKIISKVEIKHHPPRSISFIRSAVPIMIGDFYSPIKIDESMANITQFLSERGYVRNEVSLDEVSKPDGNIEVYFHVQLHEPVRLGKVLVNANSVVVKKIIENKFLSDYKMPFDPNQIKRKISEVNDELFSNGYYLISIEANTSKVNGEVVLDLSVINEQSYVFSFNDEKLVFRKDEFLIPIRDFFKKFSREINQKNLLDIVNEMYLQKAYLNPEVKITEKNYTNHLNEPVRLFDIKITENLRTKIEEIRFKGNINKTDYEIMNIYNQYKDELASLNLYDSLYYKKFIQFLKNEYISQGFVQVEVNGPIVSSGASDYSYILDFQIKEGVRTRINRINFQGIPQDTKNDLLQLMDNKENNFFNPIVLDEELKKINDYFQNKGYFYSQIMNLNSSELVQYSPDRTSVDLNIHLDIGHRLRLGSIIILGNIKTKKKFINKRILLKPGDLLTPQNVKKIEERLSQSGLFLFVNVKPVSPNPIDEVTDLLISLQERDSIVIEVAPGYRTDLGLKLSNQIKFNNLWGMNRTFSIKAQANQRLSFSSLAPERRDDQDFIEYGLQFDFGMPDLADTKFNLYVSTSFTKKRFYSFDADINRNSLSLNRDWTRSFSTNLRYQFENISQFNAVQANDNGKFRIGSLTPSFTLDFRDNRINPTKGTYFNLSWEFANPLLFFQYYYT